MLSPLPVTTVEMLMLESSEVYEVSVVSAAVEFAAVSVAESAGRHALARLVGCDVGDLDVLEDEAVQRPGCGASRGEGQGQGSGQHGAPHAAGFLRGGVSLSGVMHYF